MARDRKTVNYKQLGLSGLNRQGSYIYEEFLPELRWPGAGKIYKEMASNDPVVGTILYLAEILIRGAKWSVKPANKTKEAVDAAKFLKECMDDMDMSWDNTICEILSMLTYGFSFHEIVYKVRRGPMETNQKYKSKYKDGKIGWRRLPIRAQDTLHSWEWDENGDVTAFIQQSPPTYDLKRIPMNRGILFRTRISRDNPEGKSLLRSAYRPWFFKKHFEEIEGIGIERDLAGFPILVAPEGMDLWNEDDAKMVALRGRAEALVASVRRDSEEGLLLPHGWDLKLLTSGSSRQIDIGATINRYDNRIAITMLSDIVLIGGDGKSGSFALADAKQSMLAAALQTQLMNIADELNSQAVPYLFQANGMLDAEVYPSIEPGQIQTPSLKELALIFRSMGLNIAGDMELQNYLRHLLGLPDLSNDEFTGIYLPQAHLDETGKPKGKVQEPDIGTADNISIKQDDTVENDFEQNAESYTGGGS